MILITGDSGFIGGYLSGFLVRRGQVPKGLDMNRKDVPGIAYPQTVGDILDSRAVAHAMQGADTVIHLAAEHKDSGIDRERFFLVNVEGTRNLLRCASEASVKKFIFFSSVAVYGSAPSPSEETAPVPVGPYGESKLEAEDLVAQWGKEDESRLALIIRPTVVFGPGNRANIFRLIRYVCDGKFIWIGKGENVKSLAYVENLIQATVFLLEKLRHGVEVFNYVDEPQMTTHDLVSLIARKAGRSKPKLSIPMGIAMPAARLMDMIGSAIGHDFTITSARIRKFNTSTQFSVEKLRSMGFKAPFTIEEGLERNIRWYMDQPRIQPELSALRSVESGE